MADIQTNVTQRILFARENQKFSHTKQCLTTPRSDLTGRFPEISRSVKSVRLDKFIILKISCVCLFLNWMRFKLHFRHIYVHKNDHGTETIKKTLTLYKNLNHCKQTVPNVNRNFICEKGADLILKITFFNNWFNWLKSRTQRDKSSCLSARESLF